MTRFDELVGGDDLSPEEEARLRRVHDLLVEAGPPPDLPPALERPPTDTDAQVVQFPMLPKRRWAAGALVAAALAAIAFGGGYLVGHGKQTGFQAWKVVPMHGKGAGLAILQLGTKDGAGNSPMQLEVTNLPGGKRYYELWLTRKGKAVAPCGYFRVANETTTVRFTVPYDFTRFDGWVITRQAPHEHGAGNVVLRT